jgi:uncharacterized protein
MALEMSGEYVLPRDRKTVYAALNDPEMLKKCIPGCEELTKEGDNEFAAVVKMTIGPVSARFKGKVRLEDLDPPNGYRIAGEGEGGVPEGTKLAYNAEANVGGKIAQLGQRLLAGSAKKIADKFFSNFTAALS